jgi:hypothetical protein
MTERGAPMAWAAAAHEQKFLASSFKKSSASLA